MPCRDYDDNVRIIDNTETYKAKRDMLSRIACRALTKLEELGVEVLDKETQDWWKQHKIDDAKEQKRLKKAAQDEAERKRLQRERTRQAELATLKKLKAKYRNEV